jgi:translation initiation factor IF-2
MRVHELAKELGISNNDIKNLLAQNGIEVKSHMSAVDDNMINIVKKTYGKKQTVEDKPVKAKVDNSAKPKPDNSTKPQTDNSAKQQAENAAKPQAEKKPQTSKENTSNKKDEGHTRFVREDRNKNNTNDRVRFNAGDKNNSERVRYNNSDRNNSDRPRYNNGDRNNSDRPRYNNGDRNNSDRPRYNNGDRNNSDRPRYNNGDRNNSDRPRYNNGDRNNSDRPRYNNGDRNSSDRPRYNNGDRNNSDRPRFNGDRNNSDRPRFANGGDRQNSDKSRFSNDNRNNKFGGRNNMSMGFGKDEDDDNQPQRRRSTRGNDRKDFDAKELPGKDLKSQNRDNYNRDKNKPRKGNRRSAEEVEADISRLAKNVKNKPHQQQRNTEEEAETIRTITLPETITIKELADIIKEPVNALIKKLFLSGKMVNVNSELDFDAASEIALEYNCIAEEEEKVDVIEELLKEDEENEEDMVSRPPVVCVMGHVDHGKTSLLDAIRETNVTSGEAGGITQAIGASVVEANGETITFLDTPGHEAFTAMRMRGAQSTDIAILVVAADDGVMPQTIEAINHAKAAGIEIIVAINKIDKPSANIERVKQELTEYELIPEDWGGSTIFCPVSAHTREGIDNLLDMILLTAEVLELKANPNRKARGIVIEAELDKGRGPVATMLVQKGTLKVGDSIAVGASHGKVRAMTNSKGERVTEATPSTPVQILGLDTVPAAGEIFMAVENEKEARQISETYISQGKVKLLADTKSRMSLDDLYSQIQAGNVKELNIIIKADVQGSVEAVKQSLLKLSNEEVAVKCIHAGVGAINESDIILASASNAIVIGFNVRPDARAKDIADSEGVDVRLYRVIYNAIEDIESAMKGMLDPIFEEQIIGHAEIRQTYKASGVGMIAGSYILDGTINRNCSVRITREGNLIYEGKLASLKRFKDDVKEVKSGFECGIVLENFNDIQVEDQIEAYQMVEVPRK